MHRTFPLASPSAGAAATALCAALVAGCGAVPADPAAAGGAQVAFEHQAQGNPPPVVLPDYQYIPTGPALSQSAGQIDVRDARINYGLALRTAALKLRGDLPTMKEIRRLQAAVKAGANDNTERDPYFVYKDLVRGYIYDNPQSFNRQMMNFWRTTLRMSGKLTAILGSATPNADPAKEVNARTVDLDTGPALAAMLVASDRDMRELFTSATGNCPTFDAVAGTFTAGNCNTGATLGGSTSATVMGNNVDEGKQAGILTHPGFQAQYYSNMGMRRGRALNELFACQRYPAEYAAKPTFMTSFLYSAPWPYDSVTTAGTKPTFTTRQTRGASPTATKTTASLDFVDFHTDCQNCHSTLNHRVPLFATFDAVGYRDPNNSYRVVSPVTDSPFAQLQEYLPPGKQELAWKAGVPTPDFQSFGKAMAADDQVVRCFMIRAWNNAYSRNDVVIDLALVPESVVADLTTYFMANGYNMKKALLRLYTDPNFLRY